MKGFGPSFRALTSTLRNPAAWLAEFIGGADSKTGIKVSTDTALGLAPVIYAVNKISGHLAQLPVKIYDPRSGDKVDEVRSPAYMLLNKRANEIMTSFTVKEVMMIHALINGNGRAYILRNEIGTPVGLIPLAPHDCQTVLAGNKKYHLVTKNNGSPQSVINDSLIQGEYYKVPDRDILHIMNASYNGIWGMHIIEMAKDVFGLTQAAQEATAVTMANSGRPGLILEAPKGTFRNPKDAQVFLDNFNAKHEGVSNSGKAGMLREGMTVTTVPVSAQDAQFLQQRNFQREEIAMMFGLESIMGDNTGQTYRSISERNTAYVNNCLQRWFAKWEHEVEKKLINSTRGLVCEFDSTPLAKGDPNSLADYTLKMAQAGLMTPNEARAMHGLPPIEGGDELPQNNPAPATTEEQGEPEENEDEAGE